jgi:hypothetical protein
VTGSEHAHGQGRAAAPRFPPLAAVGFVLFALSWFLPVVPQQWNIAELREHLLTSPEPPRADAPGMTGPDWLPGWLACRCAWRGLVDDWSDGIQWQQRVLGATCLTNLVMLGAVAVVGARRRRPTRAALGTALLGCAVLDASWLYLGGAGFGDFAPGYWLWLGSFVLAGLALLTSRRG